MSKMFNDHWMADHGYIPKNQFGDLRDIIGRPFFQGSLITATPEESLRSVYTRMKTYDISQIPVIERGKVVGIIDESDLLFALQKNAQALKQKVSQVMSKRLKTLEPKESIEKVIDLLKKDMVAIVADQKEFFGIITKIDLVEYLRTRNE